MQSHSMDIGDKISIGTRAGFRRLHTTLGLLSVLTVLEGPIPPCITFSQGSFTAP